MNTPDSTRTRPTAPLRSGSMIPMSNWTIDEDFHLHTGEPDGAYGGSGYTWDEFCAKPKPPCPACGTPADIDAVPLRPTYGGPKVDLFLPGLWSCPNRCQRPR